MLTQKKGATFIVLLAIILIAGCVPQPDPKLKKQTAEIHEKAILAEESALLSSLVLNPASTYAVYIVSDHGSPHFARMPNGTIATRYGSLKTGSGFFINSNGLILTNYHVIENSQKIAVAWGGNRYDATVIGRDKISDLAVIKIERLRKNPPNSFPQAPLGDSDTLKKDDTVRAVGFPAESSPNSATITRGSISNIRVERPNISPYNYFIYADAQIISGSSGGFLVDVSGNIMGVSTFALGSSSRATSSIGGFIPINHVKKLLPQLVKGDVLRGSIYIDVKSMWLVRLNLIDELLVQEGYNITIPDGVNTGIIVLNALPGKPAASAGIIRGDIITHVNGLAIDDSIQFYSLIDNSPPGTHFNLTVLRENLVSGLKPKIITVQSTLQ